jgi:hypothetical protein
MNNTMFIARSLVFYPGLFEENCKELSDEIVLPSYHLNKLMERFEDDEMLYLSMTNTNTNLSCLVTIGSSHTYDKNTIYAPQWVLELIGCTGNCDSVITISKADVTDLPPATKIVIRPLDPIAFELDTTACFEKAFMNLHSIKEGITIPVPVPELGKEYRLFAHIEKVEPATVCRIVEGEVEVDFINDFKETFTPIIEPPTPHSTPILAPMIPTESNHIITPIASLDTPQISAEERREQIRQSWLKRYQNTSTPL